MEPGDPEERQGRSKMKKIVLLLIPAVLVIFLYRLARFAACGIASTHNRRPTRAAR